MKLKNILFPVDFTDRCRHVSQYVIDLARHYGSTITMIHVVPPIDREVGLPDFASPALAGMVEQRNEVAKGQIAEFLKKELRELPVERKLAHGDPAEEIIKVCRELPADLVVMPTHGRGGFRRFLLGSITGKILHDSECPVWTAAHVEDLASHRPLPLQRVLCAVDLGKRSEDVLRWAASLAADRECQLSIVHAIPSLPIHTGEFNYDPSWTRDESRPIRQEIEALKERTGAQGQTLIYIGDPHRVVHSAALDSSADLVVIGRPVQGGLLGRLHENAYAIIRESPCPVVSI